MYQPIKYVSEGRLECKIKHQAVNRNVFSDVKQFVNLTLRKMNNPVSDDISQNEWGIMKLIEQIRE